MINTGKYTELFSFLHPLTSILLILFLYATPQTSKAFGQSDTSGIKVLTKPMIAQALEGEFIIGFNSQEKVRELGKSHTPEWLQKLGADVKINRNLANYAIAHVQVGNPAGIGQWQNLADILSGDPNVSYVEPNYIYYSAQSQTGSDPLAEQMWYVERTKAYESWSQFERESQEVIVAVIDSGIHSFHDDLRGKIWVNTAETVNNGVDDDENGYVDDIIGWNFYDDNNLSLAHLHPQAHIAFDEDGVPFCKEDPSQKSYESHGTHVAATIAAVANNGIGASGVAPNVKIMPLKALGGPCGTGSTLSLLLAASYAYSNGAKIINMSLGGPVATESEKRFYKALSDAGVLVVAAAGNEALNTDRTPHYPSGFDFDGIISVGASDRAEAIADFSNRGQKTVDLFAPGTKIINAIPSGQKDQPDSDYAPLSGTSMATPIVSGAAAIIWGIHPDLSHTDVKAKLLNGVQPFDHMKAFSVSGGRLDILSALKAPVTPQKTPEESLWGARPDHDLGGIRIFDNRRP